jgi:hypothetical protein
MAAVASSRVMLRSCLLALLAFAALAPPALATDASVTFKCCAYTPNSVRVLPGEKLTVGDRRLRQRHDAQTDVEAESALDAGVTRRWSASRAKTEPSVSR